MYETKRVHFLWISSSHAWLKVDALPKDSLRLQETAKQLTGIWDPCTNSQLWECFTASVHWWISHINSFILSHLIHNFNSIYLTFSGSCLRVARIFLVTCHWFCFHVDFRDSRERGQPLHSVFNLRLEESPQQSLMHSRWLRAVWLGESWQKKHVKLLRASFFFFFSDSVILFSHGSLFPNICQNLSMIQNEFYLQWYLYADLDIVTFAIC